MASKRLTTQQADTRQRLLRRLAQLAEDSGHGDPLSSADLSQIESKLTTPSKANRPRVMFRGKVKVVSPDEKERFYVSANFYP